MNVEINVDTGHGEIAISNYDQEFPSDTQKTKALSIAGLLGDSVAQVLLDLSGQDGAVLAELRARFQGAIEDALR
jgi:L-fucose mutarotase/ribose pyranase (RbsD/FucU family)